MRALHTFAGASSGDGAYPASGLVMDSAGNLYGATQSGGAAPCPDSYSGCGTIFEIDGAGNETVLHSFDGTDGYSPYANLILDPASHTLYGTTQYGGSNSGNATNFGTVFKYVLPAPAVPPLAIKAKLQVSGSGFQLQALITQTGGPAIDPSSQGMTLVIGSPAVYSAAIEAGSWQITNKGTYVFQGALDGVAIQARVNQTSANTYTLQYQASGVNMRSAAGSPPVTLTFGPNTGTTPASQ